MVEVTVRDGVAVFEVEGMDKLWALKSCLKIPLAHIRDVRLDTEAARGWWPDSRRPVRIYPESSPPGHSISMGSAYSGMSTIRSGSS